MEAKWLPKKRLCLYREIPHTPATKFQKRELGRRAVFFFTLSIYGSFFVPVPAYLTPREMLVSSVHSVIRSLWLVHLSTSQGGFWIEAQYALSAPFCWYSFCITNLMGLSQWTFIRWKFYTKYTYYVRCKDKTHPFHWHNPPKTTGNGATYK
jgi:hypothetical protein